MGERKQQSPEFAHPSSNIIQKMNELVQSSEDTFEAVGQKMLPLDLPPTALDVWPEKPSVDPIEDLPAQDPIRVLLSVSQNPEKPSRSIQLHVRLKGMPDYITLVYQLHFVADKLPEVVAYLNKPIAAPGDGPYRPFNMQTRNASIEDLEAFDYFLRRAEPVKNKQAWISE